jgi:transposase InsO family protein
MGPKKIKGVLDLDRPTVDWPAASSIGELFKKHGLVRPRRRRRKPSHPGFQSVELTAPNQIWTTDFKGEFKTLDGVYCYPLTIADAFSRYLLAVDGLPGPRHAPTRAVFERVFSQFGLRDAIRTDNGTPFASQAIHRLSRLHVWWIKLGVTPLLNDLASPHQNGSHERMHRTLKEATALPPAKDAFAQQTAFDRFRIEYNEFRPHEALGQQRPTSHYRPSHRPYPYEIAELEYPPHFELRKVSNNGGIRWRSGWVNVSHVLAGEHVGLEEVDFEVWSVYFGPLLLGRFKEEDLQLHGAHAYNVPT